MSSRKGDEALETTLGEEIVSDDDNLVGRLWGHYRVVDRLGAGAMGVVYRARDERLARSVALKVLPATACSDTHRRERFLREARAVAGITHSNLAVIYELGEVDGCVFIAMELIEGMSLRERLEQHPRAFSEDVVTRIGIQIAAGLGCAHAAGVSHRDVKPDNVMLTSNDVVKVIDFGLAKLREQPSTVDAHAKTGLATDAGTILGTPAYMAPEQIRGQAIDSRTDVFACGAILYEMATGRRPFVADSVLSMLVAIDRDAPAPIQELNPSISSGLSNVIERCLQKSPDDRYPDGKALAEALANASTAPPTTRRPPTRPRGLPVLVGLTILAVLVTGVILRSRNEHTVEPNGTSSTTSSAVASSNALPSNATLGNARPSATARAITDHAAPVCAQEAAKLFREALRLMRSAAWLDAHRQLLAAWQADNQCAEVGVYLVVTGFLREPPARRQELFTAAMALRERLSERDRLLLESFQPALRASDTVLFAEKMRALADRFPNDAELAVHTAFRMLVKEDSALLAKEYAERALKLDSGYADAWQMLGEAYIQLDDATRAESALVQCAEVAPDGVDCLRSLAILRSSTGDCRGMQKAAEDALRRIPSEHSIFPLLAMALASQGASGESVAEVIAQGIARAPSSTNELLRLRLGAQLAVLEGNFERATTLAKDWRRLGEGSREMEDHYGPEALLMEIALEIGEMKEAEAIATSLHGRRSAWRWSFTRDVITGLGRLDELRVVDVLLAGQRIDWSVHEDVRSQFIDTFVQAPATHPTYWLMNAAVGAFNAEEARAALLTMPKSAEAGIDPDLRGEIGRLQFLAGNPKQAVAHLRYELNACYELARPFRQARTELLLAQALEAANDQPAACEAYATVTRRWGGRNSKSQSAALARERINHLKCAAK